MVEQRQLHFPFPPRTFVDVPGFSTIWKASERTAIGIYLWCIEVEGTLRVNYVGKTSGATGFDGRLRTEFRDWRKGLYSRTVDLDAFLAGRVVLLTETPADYLERKVTRLVPRYRILMAPAERKEDCLRLEGAVVNRLRGDPAAFAYLANGDRDRGYARGADVELEVISSEKIVGLNC